MLTNKLCMSCVYGSLGDHFTFGVARRQAKWPSCFGNSKGLEPLSGRSITIERHNFLCLLDPMGEHIGRKSPHKFVTKMDRHFQTFN